MLYCFVLYYIVLYGIVLFEGKNSNLALKTFQTVVSVWQYSFLPSSEQDIRQRLLSSIPMHLAAFLKYRIIKD